MGRRRCRWGPWARRGNVLAGNLPPPVALLKREALAHNIAWLAGGAAGLWSWRRTDAVAAGAPFHTAVALRALKGWGHWRVDCYQK